MPDRLSSALTMLLGIDPIVPLTDFAELPPAEAVAVIEWAARTLVRSVVDDGVPPMVSSARRPKRRGQRTLVRNRD